jgi:Ca2+/Na+ antiporter
MKNKHFLLLFALICTPIIIAWTFNHINPWIGMLLFFFVLFLINQYFNQHENKK